jgi:hypothetical protein
MVANFRGGSSRHDLHLLGVVRPVNEMIRATVVRELLGDLLCGVPRRDGSTSNTRPRSLTSGCTRTTGHSILGVAFHCDGMCLHDHQPRPSFTATRAGCPRERREKAQGQHEAEICDGGGSRPRLAKPGVASSSRAT